jgi:hypothetical protein
MKHHTPKPKPDHHSKNVAQRPNGLKPTNDELEKRIEEVELLMARGARPSQIHAAICKKYGIHWNSVNRYMVRARKNIQKRFARSREQHRADSFTFYESMIMAGDASPGAKIRARQRIDELLGLDAPKRTELSGPDGVPIQTEDKTEPPTLTPAQLRRIIHTLEPNALTNGEAKHQHNGESGNGKVGEARAGEA